MQNRKMKKILAFMVVLTLVFGSMAISASAATTTTKYVVKSGDVLWKIAKTHNTTVDAIVKQNQIKNPNLIKAGQTLYIGGSSTAAAPAKSTTTKPAPATPAKPAADPYASIKGTTLTIATTTSTNDTGLLDAIVPAFDKKYGTKTKWVSLGSGEAMEMGKRGDADVLLVHSRAAEDQFIADGYGLGRKDVMYNFFYIIGPKGDPAKVKAAVLAKDGLKAVYEAKSPFISRSDNSGTHTRELNLWKAAVVSPDAKKDTWYKEAGAGMVAVLEMANEMKAYTIADSGTWGSSKDKLSNLEIVLQGDTALYNPYGVIVVNPAKYPNLNTKAAQAFSEFLTSSEGQKLIADYQKNGQRLFVPNAK